MTKQRVPLWQRPQKYVAIEPEATIGAIVGVDLRLPDGTVVTAQQIFNPPAPTGQTITDWSRIRNVPPDVAALADIATTGLYVITGEGTSLTRAIAGTPGQIVVTDGDGVSGPPTVDLATLADTGVGAALVKTTRDAYGRTEGQEAATTTDLPEGTNLYYTDGRADARAALAVAAHEAAGDPHPQYLTAAEGDAAYQPIDATLTALAGVNWAANSIPIGSGPDTLNQQEILANHFIARSSSGNAGTFQITDNALALLADTDVPRLGTANIWSAAQTFGGAVTVGDAAADTLTVNAGTLSSSATSCIHSGNWTPTITGVANLASSTAHPCYYVRIGNVVVCVINADLTATAAAATLTTVRFSLPIASAFTTQSDAGGTLVVHSPEMVGRVWADATNDELELSYLADTTAGRRFAGTVIYVIK